MPHGDEQRLFEKLVLEGFQSGLSWLTILRKREAFRDAFDGFDAERMARYDEQDITRLMANAAIVRNQRKIVGSIASARAYLALREQTTLGEFLSAFVIDARNAPGLGAQRDVPTQTAVSRRMALALKARGFQFVGPTTAYAFMQSVGLVNDHLACCHRRGPCEAARRVFLAERTGCVR